jgi:predicted acetyltransferase
VTEGPEIVLRHLEASELGAYRATTAAAFGWPDPPDDVDMGEWMAALADPDRMLAAVQGELFVGVAGSFPFRMTVPGGEVPAAGVTHVGVLPTHRRRGILTRLMHVVLDDALAAGEPVAYLWASEDAIYQRFGFGIAALTADMSIQRDRSAFLEDTAPTGRVRMLSASEALDVLPDLYERVRVETPGAFARSRVWWERHRLWDRPWERDGATGLRITVWEMDGAARAYAIWRVRPGWGDGGPEGRVIVHEVAGLDPEATREIWRFLFGIDLTTRITAGLLATDHPLQYLVAEPRRLLLKLGTPLWLRIVEVKGALEGRAYPVDGEVVFELADRFRPANEGRWRLEAGDGKGRCERTDATPDLRLSVNDLGAVYLGGTPLDGLARAGRVTELTEGAVVRADALFRWHRAPWCPEIF